MFSCCLRLRLTCSHKRCREFSAHHEHRDGACHDPTVWKLVRLELLYLFVDLLGTSLVCTEVVAVGNGWRGRNVPSAKHTIRYDPE